MKNSTPFHIVIPARYGSSRLPGKPLKEIGGKAMVCHVMDNARAANPLDVLVATDDARIEQVVKQAGGEAVMTAACHRSGTDRINEVAAIKGWADDDLVINLQGDEPTIAPALLTQVASALVTHEDAGMATLCTPITDVADMFNPNVVKVVCSDGGLALYFSRAPIPYCRDQFDREPVIELLPANIPAYRHLGLYAYRVGALRQISIHPPVAIELAESLEQLRALSMGIPIAVEIIDNAPSHGVDTIDDLNRLNSAWSDS